MIPYNEDKTAKLNQINAGGPTGVNAALTAQMNGDLTHVECKCRSEDDDCDFNPAACTEVPILTAGAGGGHRVNGDDSRLVKLTSHFKSVCSVSSFVCLLVLKAPFTLLLL